MRDAELDLLNRLAREFTGDIHRLARDSWLRVSVEYAEYPQTVCSEREALPGMPAVGQSALGFLNQSRKARGLPVITMHTEARPGERAPMVWFSSACYVDPKTAALEAFEYLRAVVTEAVSDWDRTSENCMPRIAFALDECQKIMDKAK